LDRLTVHLDKQPIYDIIFTDEFYSLIGLLEEQHISNRKICIVTETNVANYYLDSLTLLLQDKCTELISFVFPEGEASKTLSTVEQLYERLILSRFDRSDLLIALGGGVVGDLTGYAAATYLRGIDFIQIPTSLLAQVDSSIGGKTGVDFSSYKNMVGAFHMPRLVYMNVDTLTTLSDRQFVSGLGEIIKHGLIKDREYFDWLVSHFKEIINRDKTILTEMVIKSCDIKRRVVEEDPTEQGDRALLNFGHTLGHAIEKMLNFSYLHGECVAIGSILSSIMSYNMGLISREDLDKIIQLFNDFGFPPLPEDLDINEMISITKSDKKMHSGKIKFILIKSIGDAYIDSTITDAHMESAVRDLYATYNHEIH